MPIAPRYWTAEMVRALPSDGNRYEVVWGELLVTPAPRLRHQRILARVYDAVRPYCVRNALGEVLWSPADISWSDDTLVQPDLFVVAPEEANAREWTDVRTLRLVVEALSPSTEQHDRFQKRRLYQEEGVGTLWLVDSVKRVVEVWTPDRQFPTIEGERLTWQPAGADAPLVIEVAALFD
jgi:Uma2 family endonuclease